MSVPDKQLSADQSRQVAEMVREEIARRRISRQSLAEQAKLSGYAGGNKGVAELLPENVQQYLATSPSHLANTLVVDDNWWEANGPAAEKRFTGWVIAK